jgi:Rps23 Pro-64 3,4-dihydroxylase Tpa1-like proline 4-hydroxylase
MPSALAIQKQSELFPYSKWGRELPALAKQYRENHPFPHICLTDFLDAQVAQAIAEEFPRHDTDAWTHYKHQNENKSGLAKRDLFPPQLGQVTDELNSPEFVEWLSVLTSIPGLMADPRLEGGGLHQSGRGGFLNMHADFTMNHYHKNWRRRVNLILYLNDGLEEEWGGSIEVWDKQMQHCVVKMPPLLNHALIFNTDEISHHAFPEPLRCPEKVSRKSLALYYYTIENNPKSAGRSTNYHARPEDGLGKTALIWLDKKAVDLYSKAKSRFGFSDDFASKVLGRLSGKK